MKKEIKVRSEDNKQFILKPDGTYVKVKNFKVGDSFKFILPVKENTEVFSFCDEFDKK